MTDIRRPVPRPSPETTEFWEACRQERFQMPQCRDCGSFWFPPSAFCPQCWSLHWDWREASGSGQLHTFVIFRRQYHPAFPTPYALGVAQLEEGPRVLGRILTDGLDRLHVGLQVKLVWDHTGEWNIPAFQPVYDSGIEEPKVMGILKKLSG
ncbi:MAG: hypothetical protein EPN30_02850 [Actinomycetota bacterium]|nr:MAG: hypothetical protein EPN30_02850 [Actinomycetota bacterium]